MLVEQVSVALCGSLGKPVGSSLRRVDAHISLRVVEVGVVVGSVVGVGSDEEHHLVGILHRELAALVAHRTALSHSLDAHSVLHGVVVETCQPAERVGAVSLHLARRYRVGSVGEHEVLLAAVRCREAHRHHVGRMRHEILALVLHAVLAETHLGKSRVERQLTTVAGHAHRAESGLDVELACCCEAAEAERLLGISLVGHHAVEVLACEQLRLLPVALGERLAYLAHHMSRLLVHVPVVGSATRGVRTAAPERLLVERDALSLNRAEHIAADIAVADGQRLRLPFGVGVVHQVAGTHQLALGRHTVGTRSEPHSLSAHSRRTVEPIFQRGVPLGESVGRPQGTKRKKRKELLF